jgi:addiction module RelE/StbE family toxin
VVRCNDLDEIFRHIATDNPQAARSLIDRIKKVAKLIAALPLMGQKVRKSRFRWFRVEKYLIVYEVLEEEVIVHYIRHGARLRPWEGEKKK